MKYRVSARSWPKPGDYDYESSSGLYKQFGKEYSEHELTDAEVIEAIIQHGRAEITNISDGIRTLQFHNDYD